MRVRTRGTLGMKKIGRGPESREGANERKEGNEKEGKLTEDATSHDLSAHRDKKGEMEHVAGTNEPMYKKRRCR